MSAYSRFLLIAALHAPCVLAVASDKLEKPWQEALQFNYSKSVSAFELQLETPKTLVAQASALLSSQPLTAANIRESHALLLKARDTAKAGSDECIWAEYLLARVEQDHLTPRDTASASRRYQFLIDQHTGTFAADQAAVQLALIWFATAPDGAMRTTLEQIQALLPQIASDEAKRDLHYILGIAYWRDLHDADAALAHLQAMRMFPDHIPSHLADMDLVIAGIAKDSGKLELALKHYRLFVEQLPRNIRTGTVRKTIAELEQAILAANNAR